MSQGKKLENRTHKEKAKSIVLLVSIVFILVAAVGTTIAFLIDATNPIVNTFLPSDVTTTVEEETPGGVKNNVRISNIGDITAYIRADVFFTWKHEETGVIAHVLPVEGVDYTIEWSGIAENGGWKQGIDGFYYHLAPVDANDSTSTLFTACEEIENAPNKPDGYVLSVEIIGSGIQSVPTKVVTEMWSSGVSGVNDDATLEIITGGEG